MKRGMMCVFAAGLALGLVGCGSTPSEPITSSFNLPEPPASTIPAVASIGPRGGTPASVGQMSYFRPAMFPATPDARTRLLNQQAARALRDIPISPGDVVNPVTR